MDCDEILGWEALYNYTGMSDQILRRSMALYGFPKPNKKREGSRLSNVWSRKAVAAWLLAQTIPQSGIRPQPDNGRGAGQSDHANHLTKPPSA